jgi:hypothetical protein
VNGVLTLTIRVAETTDDGDIGFGLGLLGVLLTAGLVATVIFLYRSMRTQLKRIDFDPQGLTDEERMRGGQESRRPDGDTDGDVNGYHKPPTT